MQLDRDGFGYHHAAARDSQDNRVRCVAIALQCYRQPFTGIHPIAENHPTYNRSMPSAAASMPGIGDQAPDFSLPGTPDGDPVALSSFRGSKHVLICFYVFDFSPG